MIDFLLDNPFLLVIILFWIFNTIFGKKKPKVEEAKSAGVVAERQQKPAKEKKSRRNTSQSVQRFKNRFQEEMAKLEREAGATGDAARALAALRTEPGGAATLAGGGSMSSVPGEAEVPGGWLPDAVGDTREEAYEDGRSDVFSYHSAIDETADTMYHLSGFREFHRAGGLTDEDRLLLAENEPKPSEGPSPAAAIALLLADRNELRRAMLLQEILGKPVALRSSTFRGPARP